MINANFGSILFAFLFSLALGLGVFLLLRVLMLWYWRVDRIVELLESVDTRLAMLNGRVAPAQPVMDAPRPY